MVDIKILSVGPKCHYEVVTHFPIEDMDMVTGPDEAFGLCE